MKIKKYPDKRLNSIYLKVRYDEDLDAFFFDIIRTDKRIVSPTVEIKSSKARQLAKFIEGCLEE